MLDLKLKKLHPDAIQPTIGTPESACFDLYALEDVDFQPGEIKLVRTGWSAEPPAGFRINIYVRSSTSLKKHFTLANNVGIIDVDYRGELCVQLRNVKMHSQRIYGNDPFDAYGECDQYIEILDENYIRKGEKIAQFELVPSNPAKWFNLNIVEELTETQRGISGFGSTGV